MSVYKFLGKLLLAVLLLSQVGKCDPHPHYYLKPEQGATRTIQYDVAVYGGTPAGVTAAIQSARGGKKTVLLSFNQYVGGMTSGGLTATDLGRAESIGGLALEFYNRLGKKSNFRPSEAESLFLKMLEEEGVTVLLGQPLDSVVMSGHRLLSLSMETGVRIEASIFVDSTYEGDLLAAANVSYQVGREPAAAYGESLGGQWQDVSWKDVYQFCRLPISPYVDPSKPNSGLLPEISAEPAGKPGEGDYRVQSYNFRMYLSKQADRVPFPKPAEYDPNRYALLSRFLNADSRIRWTLNYTTAPLTDGPVQMRVGDSNNAGSFSSDYVGGNYRWPDGAYEAAALSELPSPRRGLQMPFRELYELREAIFQDHVKYQQGLVYFLANDPQVPNELQDRVRQFGLDPHEFHESGHWPHQLYIREGRRMVSDYVMTQSDCESKRIATDSIGLASYPMDSHFCQRVVVEENGVKTVRNEGGFGHAFPKPYPVSYRSIIPKRSECTNLLVPVCLSSSHVAYGSIRMEPVFMILGQSAGTAATLAIDGTLAVQDVSYEQLRAKLVQDGQRLSWGPNRKLEGIVVDDATATKSGIWQTGTLNPILGSGYHHDGNENQGEKTLTFEINVPQADSYQLKLLYVANPNRSTKTLVAISVGQLNDEVLVNQQQSDGVGRSLGVFHVKDKLTVTVSNKGADGFVVVDGIQLLPEHVAHPQR